MTPFPPKRASHHVVLTILLLAASIILPHARAEDKCAAESVSFFCPKCGGMEVSDCMKCDGYLFADFKHEVCYDRKLFHTKEHVKGDPDNHYPFLWNDILGTVVWFLTAGIATACGVGGGGIYVPMGILLLRFPPKPSSGLSQASIFGASLGGLIVNIRNRHPDKFIRDTRGTKAKDENGETGKIVPYEKDMIFSEIEEDRERYLQGGDGKRKFYTRPVIDYNMALFLAPMEMAGAVMGVIIQRLFPNWLFLSFAACILGFTSFKTFKKFKVAYKKDKDKRASMATLEATKRSTMVSEMGSTLKIAKSSNDSDTNDANESSNDSGADDSADPTNEGFSNEVELAKAVMPETDDQDDPKELELRRQFLEDDSRQYPKDKIAYLCLLWIGLTVIIFLKGGKGVDSVIGITCEDAGFYVLIAAQFIWTLGFAAVFGYKNVKGTQARLAVNYPFNETDVLWDFKKLQFYSFFTFVAGIVAGLVGIGGGMVLGPLMLVLGIHPSVSTATTASMILLTSSSVAVMFVMSGLVPWEYAIFFFCICLCGAYIGKTRIDAYVKKTGMASILVGALATIIAFATVGCIVILLMNLSKVNWCFAGFNDFCTLKSDEEECPVNVMGADELVRFF